MRNLILAALIGTAGAPALAQSSAILEESQRYQDCIALIASDPENAFEDALAWRMQGGGWPARDCEARALIASGDAAGGASMLESLASMPRAGMPTELRIDQYRAAGDAWLMIFDADRARRAFDDGLELDGLNVPLLIGAARAAESATEWDVLLADADTLVAQAPYAAEGWYFRSLARLETGDVSGADTDMQAALERAPERIETLVLRGRINEAKRLASD